MFDDRVLNTGLTGCLSLSKETSNDTQPWRLREQFGVQCSTEGPIALITGVRTTSVKVCEGKSQNERRKRSVMDLDK